MSSTTYSDTTSASGQEEFLKADPSAQETVFVEIHPLRFLSWVVSLELADWVLRFGDPSFDGEATRGIRGGR